MLSQDAMQVVREAFRDRRYVTCDELLVRASNASLPDEQLAMFSALPEGKLDEVDALGALVAADRRRPVPRG